MAGLLSSVGEIIGDQVERLVRGSLAIVAPSFSTMLM
ncbi:hypothetical protein GGR94_003643 [Sulfitobacter geojensis]|nr:hypothetical protein [Sulfitobacter geojensis]